MAAGENVKTVYEQVCRSHDGVAQFRGKLLTLLPIASGAGIFLLLPDANNPQVPSPQALRQLTAAGIFGALITIGLFIYDLRGIHTCHALIESARRLEKELLGSLEGYGTFKLKPPDCFKIIGASAASLIIYPTVIGAWIYIAGIGLRPSLAFNASVATVSIVSALAFALVGGASNYLQTSRLRKKVEKIESAIQSGRATETTKTALHFRS